MINSSQAADSSMQQYLNVQRFSIVHVQLAYSGTHRTLTIIRDMCCSPQIAENFMRATSTRRAKYVAAILLLTDMATCPFLLLDIAEAWHTAFAGDHDAEFLLNGVTDGFAYQFVDSQPDGAFYRVPNYVPDVHAPKVSAWVAAETAAGRYAPVSEAFARGFAALGVVDKDHSNMASVRVVHDLPGLLVPAPIWASRSNIARYPLSGTLSTYSGPSGFRPRLTSHRHTDQCQSTPIIGPTSAWSGAGWIRRSFPAIRRALGSATFQQTHSGSRAKTPRGGNNCDARVH